jgi:thiamine pyrophosphate-dependent acetolactate synthase large subunit-like protein
VHAAVCPTAGPGVTNAMTGIANAHVARASVLVLSVMAFVTPGPAVTRATPTWPVSSAWAWAM